MIMKVSSNNFLMFLQEITEIPELEFLDEKKINNRYHYRMKIRG